MNWSAKLITPASEMLHFVDQTAIEALYKIKKQLNTGKPIIELSGHFKFTKTKKNYTEALLFRDIELESDVHRWIDSRSNYTEILGRYRNYDSTVSCLNWPSHYAMRILKGGGSICSSDNIFMFFPEVLGISTGKEEDYFGFEFIDVWSNLFNQTVFPCIRKTFDVETQTKISSNLKCALEKTIYLASVFHEMGHRVGPWKVSPQKNENLKISGFYLDILGELATDSLLVQKLHEFPEIAQFVFLQRIFWFARRGFKNNPLSGMINEDNDAWIGAYLWNKFNHLGIVKRTGNKWSLDLNIVTKGFETVLNEIDQLGHRVLATSEHQQNSLIAEWMNMQVHRDEELGFLLPEDLSEIFWVCQEVIETPHFQPAISTF